LSGSQSRRKRTHRLPRVGRGGEPCRAGVKCGVDCAVPVPTNFGPVFEYPGSTDYEWRNAALKRRWICGRKRL
jgi:hypothetical protein